jgi:hypothetical protein
VSPWRTPAVILNTSIFSVWWHDLGLGVHLLYRLE